MIYFYARVSSKDQNLDRQLEAAKAYKNIDRVFSDKQSGKNFDRPAYIEMKSVVKPGDEVVVKELDRLGRDKDGIKEEIKWFKDNGVVLRILNVPTTLIDFQGQDWIAEMVNNILIEVMGAMAQNEREKIRERQREGIDAMPIVGGKRVSSKTGNAIGRANKVSEDAFQKFLEKNKKGEMSVSECCRELGISRTAWYNRIAEVSV